MKTKILQIGSYPPPNNGWSVRIKHLKEALNNDGHDCQVLNIGKGRKVKSNEYIEVRNSLDYVCKLIRYRLKGYHFHVHTNGQAVKGPILVLTALLIAFVTFKPAALTFHGGAKQLYFPREDGGKMYWILYLNFLLPSTIICNDECIKNEIVRYGPAIGSKKVHPIPAFSVQYLKYEASELPQDIVEYMKNKKQCIVCYLAIRHGFFVETAVEFFKRLAPGTGVILTGVGEVEDEELVEAARELDKLQADGAIYIVDNLVHDQFMTLLSKSDLYLRSHYGDGVSSSVLEALYLGTPVVACENGRRPKGVTTYEGDDANDLEKKIDFLLNGLYDFRGTVASPLVEDTLLLETKVLLKTFSD